jgi:hypothetical protein
MLLEVSSGKYVKSFFLVTLNSRKGAGSVVGRGPQYFRHPPVKSGSRGINKIRLYRFSPALIGGLVI